MRPRYIAATLSSTGTPSHFLHPAEAVHGDLGKLQRDDVVVACGPASSLDTFHALTPAERSNVTVVARRADGAVEPLYVALRPVSCGAPTADLACTSGTPALLNRTLDAGTYHLVVESLPSFAGPYVLDVFTSAP